MRRFWHCFVLGHHINRDPNVTARYDRVHCDCGKSWKEPSAARGVES